MAIEKLPGFRDFYPDELAARNHIFAAWREAARRYGFREYDGPPLEPLELYTQKSGEEIVAQLYHFTDKGDRAVALRPEMTPTLARMVGARERDYKKPLKWFSIPQLFRYERQQRGRLREHFQFNADIIGEADVSADAELIALAIDSLRLLGLTADDFVVRLSSRELIQHILQELGVPENQRLDALGAIDKLEREKPDATRARLRACGLNDTQVNSLLDRLQAGPPADPQMSRLLDLLKAQGLAEYVRPDLKIVRGLAYYTGIVFELHDRQGELRAIAGGGRYDRLIHTVTGGAVDLPALGFGMGDVVLTELLRARGRLPAAHEVLDAYVVLISEELRPGALRLIHQWREEGLRLDYPLTLQKVAKQFQAAVAAQARFAVVLGPEEWARGECRLKNLAAGEERPVPLADVPRLLRP